MSSKHQSGVSTIARSISPWPTAFAIGLFTSSAWSQTYSFTPLPSDVTNSSLKALARGISGDGNVIVGSSNTFDTQEKPYVWRREAGLWTRSELPTLAGTGRAVAASFDGSTIVGSTGSYTTLTVNPGTPSAWRNAATSPTLDTPFLTAGPNGQPLRGMFNGVSASGSRVFGFAREISSASSSNAYVYDQGGSPISVATFAQITGAYPAGNIMSADGSRATHYITPGFVGGFDTGFVWSESAGSTLLATPGGGAYPRTTAISGDGRVIAGFYGASTNTANQSGFGVVWRDGVFSYVARPNLALNAFISGADHTGRVLVGAAGSNMDLVNFTTNLSSVSSTFAAIWIDGQAFSLATYLTSNGVNLGNLTPILTSGVSADGRTIVGVATRPIGTTTQREYVSFVATIPTPASCMLFAACGLAAARRRR